MKVKALLFPIIRSIFLAMGALWLPIEAYEGLANRDLDLSFCIFIMLTLLIGLSIFYIDGYIISGFLKKCVEITSNGFNTKVTIMFGDIFTQTGWKAIGVNDFFDSVVDDDLVASKSLHGSVINTYWPNDRRGWQSKINASLKGSPHQNENRKRGNRKRYEIGTTAPVSIESQKFLFVALGNTDLITNVTTATAESLIQVIRKLLQKAREVCANDALYIPLMGSGLSRVGIKNSVLVDLIIVAIFEETKHSSITNNIIIILPSCLKSEINLGSFTRNWNENGK